MDSKETQVSLLVALKALDEALEEVEGLKKLLAHQRSTIARLEGERDLWRTRGEYK